MHALQKSELILKEWQHPFVFISVIKEIFFKWLLPVPRLNEISLFYRNLPITYRNLPCMWNNPTRSDIFITYLGSYVVFK